MRVRHVVLVAAATLVAGCGYFNSLYNANRSFDLAEQASRSGDRVTATREYRSAIERAAVSYRSYPDGRWADDALLLLGRARFALGEHEAAAAAMHTLLEQSADPSMRAVAHAYRGAALIALDEAAAAVVHLDSAALTLPGDTEDGAFARLWRARASFHDGRSDDGWRDLDEALSNRRIAHAAALEGVARAVALRDSARTFAFMRHLAATPSEPTTAERVDTILQNTGADWSPSIAFNSSAPLTESAWPAELRDRIALARAHLALAANVPDAALDLAIDVGNAVSLGVGSRARRLAAGIMLERADSVSELEEVRTLLLPAYDDRAALELMRRVRAAQILLRNGADPGSSISMFAAAELLRDEVGAPRLARRVFLDFAALQQDNVWAGKAALAAHQIGPTEETVAALERLSGNPYVRAARGQSHDSSEIDRAESRLAFGIEGLRADAVLEAVRRDVVVGRAVTVLDSTRAAARSDSVRIACGMMIDSLSIAGIRADSTRIACLRGDTARVRFVLNVDTTLLRDTTARGDRAPRPVNTDTVLRPDTFALRMFR